MTNLEGTLHKWINFAKGWQYRFFVLDENAGLLSYYTSKEKMIKGVRRGCVRLKGAVLGIDDQDMTTFTITVDHKTFHFQARDGEEREKWVRRLEDTILKHANRSRALWEQQRFYASSSSGGSGKKEVSPLVLFDKKVSEADAYLQLMIEQVSKVETKIEAIEDESKKEAVKNISTLGNQMLENIKHSIVLLQIAKNTAHPINGIYQGPKKLDSVESLVPETSYSSSEEDDDFFDAHDESEFTPSNIKPFNTAEVNSTHSKTSDELYKSGEDSTSNSASLPKSENFEEATGDSPEHSSRDQTLTTGAYNTAGSQKNLPTKNDGTLDYDALYEDTDDSDDLSMESHGSVVTHLLSQVKIGMDLTKVVLPTFILERRSLLEMYADYFAHPDLFLKIVDMPTPKERMIQVVKWYLSSYHAGRKSAVAKKPYNPIIGEVFQCHWDIPELNKADSNDDVCSDGPIPWCKKNQLTFIAEQVSHHPPISAFYAEHYEKRICFTAHVWTKSKFLGLSIGVHNIGQGIVTLCDLNEEYILTFPNGYGRSILTVPWIELGGSVTITCPKTKYHADIEFLTKPFYGGKKNRISAEIFAPNEKKSFVSINGEWNGVMEAKWTDTKTTEVFIDVNSIPVFKKNVRPVAEQSDNESRRVWREVTAGLKLNDIDKATNAKFQIEQRQREEAKTRKETNEDFKNLHFKSVGDGWLFTKPLTHLKAQKPLFNDARDTLDLTGGDYYDDKQYPELKNENKLYFRRPPGGLSTRKPVVKPNIPPDVEPIDNLLGDKLCQAWFNELERSKNDSKKRPPSLLRAGFKVFGCEIALLGLVLLVLEFAIRVTQPLFLGGLIAYYSKGNDNINEAYLYAGGVIMCSLLNVLIVHPYMLSQLHTGMKMRIAACSMIYRKALRLTKNALGESTAGQVVNLLSNDVARLELSVLFVHYLWIGPLEVIEIGISTIFGVVFLLLFVPLQIFLGKLNSKLRLKTALRTDERVRFMSEIVNGIQVIKMYAWEKPFSKLVEMARRKEIQVIRQVSYIRGILLSFIMFLTRVSVFLSLIGYALLGYQIGAQKAFIVTAFFNTLRASMTVFFPQGIGQLAETLVSVQRIQKFMLYEELDRSKESLAHSQSANDTGVPSTQSTVTKGDQSEHYNNKDLIEELPLDKENPILISEQLSKAGVSLENVTAKWDPSHSENTLNNVNLRVQPGTLVAVVGPVGAGKSSLIQTILGELLIESGKIEVNGQISYASQEPWLFSASIRQNILFGLPYEKERYKKVVKRCALERDFSLFSNGDKTIVGERGTSLSGGQKARINLARAVYRDHDIYLLDDPLSAVDSHVGRHLFDQCIRLQLRGKVVILVTHQLQYLQNVDQIVILEHGHVKAVGTYDSLRESGLDFAKLLANPEETEDERERSLSRSSSKNIHTRRSSNLSADSDDHMDTKEELGQIEEKKQDGNIGFTVYKKYFKASGGWCMFSFLAFMCIFAQFLASSGDYFLTYWVNKQENVTELQTNEFNNTETNSQTKRDIKEDWDNFWMKIASIWESFVNDENFDVYLFTIITILTVVITLARSVIFFNSCMRASKNLHNTMFIGITHARMYFFNTNPSGRILNRFSKDMGQVDEILPGIAIDVIQIFLALAGIIFVVAIVNPYFLIPTVIIGVIFYLLRVFYLKTSTAVKRIEATTRSPIYSHLAASLNGLSTIRAFKAEQILIHEFDSHQDLHSSAFYLFMSASRAFGFWLDMFCVLYVAIVTLSFFVMESNGGNVGLAITQALGLTGMGNAPISRT
uniref:Oxysterol-binding protein n=1 Tax=Culicoides sonorensis TaxID=179676 RepID=A0A336LKT5_CULSO